MKTILLMDEKDYDEAWKRFYREASRAIIIRDGKIALVKSKKEGWYKFPGGGVEKGESKIDAMIRETLEETGISVRRETVKEYGMVHEIRKSIYYDDEIFEQKSFYYKADAEDAVVAQSLNGYEAELGYELNWVDINTAYETNMSFKETMAFPVREACVLKMLLEETQQKVIV